VHHLCRFKGSAPKPPAHPCDQAYDENHFHG
jgi:hypothetical protein